MIKCATCPTNVFIGSSVYNFTVEGKRFIFCMPCFEKLEETHDDLVVKGETKDSLEEFLAARLLMETITEEV